MLPQYRKTLYHISPRFVSRYEHVSQYRTNCNIYKTNIYILFIVSLNLIQNSQAVKKECGLQKAQNSPELSLLKFLPLTYHHSHFLAATLDFTSFFTIACLRAALFLTAWLFWIIFHFFLYLYTPKLTYSRLWGFLNLSFFSFPQERRKDEADEYFKYF